MLHMYTNQAITLKLAMSYSSEEEDYTCNHTMSNCNCHEDPDEPTYSDLCWYCNKSLTDHPYRVPKIHGGWSGYFCSWEHVEMFNIKSGGNSMGRQCYINQFKTLEKHWTASNPGY